MSQRASSGPLIGADELWAAVPISERPTVAFILRNPKVPRVLRQTVLNRLLVRELGSAAASSGEKGLRAVALLAVSQERRAVCVKAAVAAETDLYKRSNNKSVRHCIHTSHRNIWGFDPLYQRLNVELLVLKLARV